MVVVSSKRRVHRVCLEFKAFQKQCTWCRLYSKVFDHTRCFVYQKKGCTGCLHRVQAQCAHRVHGYRMWARSPNRSKEGCRTPGALQVLCTGVWAEESKSSQKKGGGIVETAWGFAPMVGSSKRPKRRVPRVQA